MTIIGYAEGLARAAGAVLGNDGDRIKRNIPNIQAFQISRSRKLLFELILLEVALRADTVKCAGN